MAETGKVFKTIIGISGEISPSLGKAIEGVEKKFKGINIGAIAVGASIGGIAVATGAAVAKATKYLANLGDEFNRASNNISAATGLVGEDLEQMNDVLKDVYGSNFGESMEDAAAGIQQVYRNTGLVGDELADVTKAAYALSDTFEYDIAESSRAAKALMTNFGISGQEAMEMIAYGAQNGLDFSGELIDSINEYSVQFAKIGMSADDMFNTFAAGAENGAWNLDKVGDAVKEFSIRSIDGSKSTMEAYAALGLSADEMMQTFALGGEDANAAFKDVAKALIAMEDPIERDAVGVKLFGTMWEDLGVEAVAAMANATDAAYGTGEALATISKVKYDNLGDAFEGIKRQAEVSLLPLATTIANALVDLAPLIGDVFEDLGPIIERVTADMMPFIDIFLSGMADLLSDISPLVSDLAAALLPLVSDLVANLLPPLLDLAQSLIPPLVEILTAILPPIVSILMSVLPILVKVADLVLPALVDIIHSLLPTLMPVLDVLMMLLNDVVLPLLPPILELVGSLLPLIEPLLTVVLSALQPVLKLLGPLAETLGVIVGWISKVVGWVADGLTWVVDLVFGGADASNIPAFATGGFTDGLSIAGEDPNYPTEAIISFNPAFREQNLAYWAKAGQMLGAETEYTLSTSGNSYVDLGGVTFSPNITVQGNANKEDIMAAIREAYPEFLDMLDELLAEREEAKYA